MNDGLTVAGILLVLAGAGLLALIYLSPELARREKRRTRSLTHRAVDAGLRGKYSFRAERSGSEGTRGHGTYEPAGEEDRALYAAVGSRIEGEAAFFATEMLWTDTRLAWVGIPALLIGIMVLVSSVFL